MKKSKYKYRIVNGKLEPFKGKVSYNEYGLPIHVDDYGMGAVDWSLISDKKNQEERQRIDNCIWAVERLKWATRECPNEREECLKVLASGGKR